MMGKSPCFLIAPKDYTSGSVRVSKPGATSILVVENKGTRGEKTKQKKAPGKDVFMFTYTEKNNQSIQHEI